MSRNVIDGAGGGSSSPPVSFVFRPGGTTGRGVYTTWGATYAAAIAAAVPGLIWVDDSLAAAQVPAGTYNLVPGTQIKGAGVVATLDVLANAFVNGLSAIDDLFFTSHGATTPIQFIGNGASIFNLACRGFSGFASAGTAPCVLCTSDPGGGDELNISLYDEGYTFTGATPAQGSIKLTGGGDLGIFTSGSSRIQANSLAAPTAAQVALTLSADTILSATQTGILDTHLLPAPTTRYGQGSLVAYDDTLVWPHSTLGSTVQTAIDQLKAGTAQHIGANYPDGSFSLDVSLGDTWRIVQPGTLTANRTITLTNTLFGPASRGRFLVTRLDTSAFTLTVVDGVFGGTLAVLPASKVGFIEADWQSTNYILRACGTI